MAPTLSFHIIVMISCYTTDSGVFDESYISQKYIKSKE